MHPWRDKSTRLVAFFFQCFSAPLFEKLFVDNNTMMYTQSERISGKIARTGTYFRERFLTSVFLLPWLPRDMEHLSLLRGHYKRHRPPVHCTENSSWLSWENTNHYPGEEGRIIWKRAEGLQIARLITEWFRRQKNRAAGRQKEHVHTRRFERKVLTALLLPVTMTFSFPLQWIRSEYTC